MGEGGRGTFVYPEFWNYPPYFTLQPVAETQEKQKALWRGLILNYCQSTRTFRIRVDDENFEPFHNRVIDRHLTRLEKVAFLDNIVANGNGKWIGTDAKRKDECLILWKTLSEWAETLYGVVKGTGQQVMLLEDLSSGLDAKGTDIEGLPFEILTPAIRELEKRGKARRMKSNGEDVGVKFF
jgi:ESCRT-II complex subunit VPS25